MKSENIQNRIRWNYKRLILYLGFVFIIPLIVLSIYSAFIGAEDSQSFINTIPITVFWILLLLLLIIALFTFRSRRSLPLLLIHSGCALVLIGSMRASDAGHRLQKRFDGKEKIISGTMTINKGESSRIVDLPDGSKKELPFLVRLSDFRVEKYEPGSLMIADMAAKKRWSFPVKTGTEYFLGEEYGSIEIAKLYRNFRIDTEQEKPKPFDDTGEGENRAVEILIKDADGKETTEYVFEKFEGHQHPEHEQKLTFRYVRMEKDYFSDIEIWDGGTVVKKTVEVNHPIHYGGYYFYQYGWDPQEQKYTVLNVTSDSGIWVIFTGYIVLMAGLIWHFWIKPILSKIEFKSEVAEKNGN
jgi:hypothetical protein